MTEREETPPEGGVSYDELLAEIQAINPHLVELAITRIKVRRLEAELDRAEGDASPESPDAA